MWFIQGLKHLDLYKNKPEMFCKTPKDQFQVHWCILGLQNAGFCSNYGILGKLFKRLNLDFNACIGIRIRLKYSLNL